MNIEKIKEIFTNFLEKPPSKDMYEKCLVELILEKNKLLSNPDCEIAVIKKIDEVIGTIQQYLRFISK